MTMQAAYVLPDTTHHYCFSNIECGHISFIKSIFFNRITQNLKLQHLMEGTNPLLQDHSQVFSKLSKLCDSMTVGLIKTSFRKCGIFLLDWNTIGKSWFREFIKNHFHHHQIHQIKIHQHLQTKTHLKMLYWYFPRG